MLEKMYMGKVYVGKEAYWKRCILKKVNVGKDVYWKRGMYGK